MITPRQMLSRMMGTTLLVSFALNVVFLKSYPAAVFYLPFTRVWELVAGALVLKMPRPRGRVTEPAAFVGLILMGVSVFAFSEKTPFPGWAATVPVAGTVLLLLCEESWLNRRIIANPVGINIGLISYPLYLWHWPILVLAADYKFKALTDLEKGLAIGLTFILAFVTYKTIERPIRFGKRQFAAPLLAAMAAIAAIGILPAIGLTPKLPDAVAELMAVPPAGEGMRVHECLLLETDTNDFPSNCVDRTRPLVAIWGDSTASALVPGFRRLQESTASFGIAQFTVSSCPPIVVPHAQLTDRCIQRNQKIPQLIAATRPDIVILAAVWNIYDKADTLRPSVEALQGAGIRKIVILGTVPVWYSGLPEVVATFYRRTGRIIPERIDAYYNKSASDFWMRPVADELGLQFISAWKPFCDERGCLTRIGSSLVARDLLHLTPVGAEFLVKAIAPELGLTVTQDLSNRPDEPRNGSTRVQ
jgi:SGNH domain-containing protein